MFVYFSVRNIMFGMKNVLNQTAKKCAKGPAVTHNY